MPEVESKADRIRHHTWIQHIEPARLAGRKTVTVRAGDVARECGLSDRVPAVCSALGSRQMLDQAGLQLLERRGPRQSTTTVFHYGILDQPAANRGMPIGTKPPVAATARPLNTCSPVRRAALDLGSGRSLFLISCVKTKQAVPAPAKDLYISDWFRKARACVERTGCPWRILSAHYGLVHPDKRVLPYEKTLNTMRVAERRAWAADVLAELEQCLHGVETVVFFASEHYREYLAPALRRRGVAVRVPMCGLSQGRQLAWLGDCLRG